MKASDVFTPGKYPSVTLVADHIADKQRQLRMLLDSGGTAISLSGPSKSGKTVFVQNTVNRDNLIHITGSGVDNVEKLWARVLNILGTPINSSTTKTQGITCNASANISGGVSIPLIAKANASGTLSGAVSGTSSDTNVYAQDILQLLISELKDTDYVIFIDDFHYIKRDIQGEVAKQIKEIIRNGITVVCASVPYHSDDALRANPDLSGRMVNINFNFWTEDLLLKIAQKGFAHLNVSCDDSFLLKLAKEAAGSPQLMQYICLLACYEAEIFDTNSAMVSMPGTDDLLRKICTTASSSVSFDSVYKIMKCGPKVRGSDRKSYKLKDGTICDVYPVVLRAIALDPPALTIRYPELLDRISSLCTDNTPSGSSVTGTCEQIVKLANDFGDIDLMEWDSEHDVLDIREPHLLFFLRWSDFVDR